MHINADPVVLVTLLLKKVFPTFWQILRNKIKMPFVSYAELAYWDFIEQKIMQFIVERL